jgi:hypothetical protein
MTKLVKYINSVALVIQIEEGCEVVVESVVVRLQLCR